MLSVKCQTNVLITIKMNNCMIYNKLVIESSEEMKLVGFLEKGLLLLTVYSLITLCLLNASDYLRSIENETNSNVAYNFNK